MKNNSKITQGPDTTSGGTFQKDFMVPKKQINEETKKGDTISKTPILKKSSKKFENSNHTASSTTPKNTSMKEKFRSDNLKTTNIAPTEEPAEKDLTANVENWDSISSDHVTNGKFEINQNTTMSVNSKRLTHLSDENTQKVSNLPNVIKNCTLDWNDIEEIKENLKMYEEVKEKLSEKKLDSSIDDKNLKEDQKLLENLEKNITVLLSRGSISEQLDNGEFYPSTEITIAKNIEGTTKDDASNAPTISSVTKVNNVSKSNSPFAEEMQINFIGNNENSTNKTRIDSKKNYPVNRGFKKGRSHLPQQSISIPDFDEKSKKLSTEPAKQTTINTKLNSQDNNVNSTVDITPDLVFINTSNNNGSGNSIRYLNVKNTNPIINTAQEKHKADNITLKNTANSTNVKASRNITVEEYTTVESSANFTSPFEKVGEPSSSANTSPIRNLESTEKVYDAIMDHHQNLTLDSLPSHVETLESIPGMKGNDEKITSFGYSKKRETTPDNDIDQTKSENEIFKVEETDENLDTIAFTSPVYIPETNEPTTLVLDENKNVTDSLLEETEENNEPQMDNSEEEFFKETERDGKSDDYDESQGRQLSKSANSHLIFKSTPTKNMPSTLADKNMDLNILDKEPIKSRLNVLINQIIYHPLPNRNEESFEERDYPTIKSKNSFPSVENVQEASFKTPPLMYSENDEYENMLQALHDVHFNGDMDESIQSNSNKFKREMKDVPCKDKKKTKKSMKSATKEDPDEDEIEEENAIQETKYSVPLKKPIKRKSAVSLTLKNKLRQEESETIQDEEESSEEIEEDTTNFIVPTVRKKIPKSIVPANKKAKQLPKLSKPFKPDIKSLLDKRAKKTHMETKSTDNSKEIQPSEEDLNENGLPDIVYIPFKNSNNLDVKSLLLLSNALSKGDSMNNYFQPPETNHYFAPSNLGSNYIVPTNPGSNYMVPTNPGSNYVIPTSPGSNSFLPGNPEEPAFLGANTESTHYRPVPYSLPAQYGREDYDPVIADRYWQGKIKRKAIHDGEEEAGNQPHRKSFFNFEAPTREIASMIKSIQELSKQFKKS